MRTTKKEFKAQVQAHILDGLCTDETTVPAEQLQNVANEFASWYTGYNKRLHPNRQDAFISWMNGVPSVLGNEFTHYGIYTALKTWFEACGETYIERDSDKEVPLYECLFYRELLVLFRKHGIDF